MIIADDSDALGDVATEYSAGFILEAQLEAFLVRHWKSIQVGPAIAALRRPGRYIRASIRDADRPP